MRSLFYKSRSDNHRTGVYPAPFGEGLFFESFIGDVEFLQETLWIPAGAEAMDFSTVAV